jgi:uncharacterized membrane protein
MRPPGFDKRAYQRRGIILAIALLAMAGYWYKWVHGTARIWPAIVATLVSALLIAFSKYRRYLLILSLGMLVAMGALGILRTLVTKEPLLPGLIVLGVIVCVMILLGGHRRSIRWLFQEDGLGEDSRSIELNLRSATRQDSEKLGHPNPETQRHTGPNTRT